MIWLFSVKCYIDTISKWKTKKDYPKFIRSILLKTYTTILFFKKSFANVRSLLQMQNFLLFSNKKLTNFPSLSWKVPVSLGITITLLDWSFLVEYCSSSAKYIGQDSQFVTSVVLIVKWICLQATGCWEWWASECPEEICEFRKGHQEQQRAWRSTRPANSCESCDIAKAIAAADTPAKRLVSYWLICRH